MTGYWPNGQLSRLKPECDGDTVVLIRKGAYMFICLSVGTQNQMEEKAQELASRGYRLAKGPVLGPLEYCWIASHFIQKQKKLMWSEAVSAPESSVSLLRAYVPATLANWVFPSEIY